MQADIHDVTFYFRMKTGLEISDSGLADVVLSGEGLPATVQPRLVRPGYILSLQSPHTQILHPRLETQLFQQNLQAARYSSHQEADQESDQGFDYYRYGVLRRTTRWP
ncbi:hypothetical protein PILCRDRAFT_606497 [Piloderma croceum F 1598]|uniref:HAM1-like N-terminal domain-containing protein n=1 Tax=Piloderma croceum (strain F 1598) TaxID=765440 RepID=A0A0C3AVD8_PILCF|nr:hypothetical protein PILCRDRAFT_606497 [Piloderma croceum F 1598]